MDQLRVCTYNVRRDVADDAPYEWGRRCEAVAGTLRVHRPDLIGLQEPLAAQYDDLRAALPAYEWIGRSRYGGDRDGEFCPVGYRRERFEALASGTFWLSETPDDPGSVGWDGAYPRLATWVRLRDRRSDRRLVYANTHLDHEGDRARVESARLLLERLADLRGDDPAVLAGDFNATRADDPYGILAGEGDAASPFVDAREATPHRPHGPSTSMTDFESLVPETLIDHVFVAGLEVTGYAVATNMGGDGWFPSDHLPVVVDLAV